MKTKLFVFFLAGSALLSSCASIVSHSRWPIALTSAPVGATVSVLDRSGKEVFSGTTPATTSLKSGASFFKRAKYTINFTKPGFATKTMALEADVNGWYFGNLLLGGVIGMLIVDPATGAMYRLNQKEVQAALSPTTSFNWELPASNSLRILSLEQVPDSLRPLLVRVPDQALHN